MKLKDAISAIPNDCSYFVLGFMEINWFIDANLGLDSIF
jgi:hypothetical protein